jgi:hypothetical protein
MKIRVSLKTPDALEYAVRTAVARNENVTEDEYEDEKARIMVIAAKWFEYGEYIIVEIDTEAKTCVVIPLM